MKNKELKKKETLTPFEADLMYAVGCLCSGGAVSVLNFTDIFSPEKKHEIIESLESLTIWGYVKYYDEIIYGTKGNKWNSLSLNDVTIQEWLDRLIVKTSINIFQDRLLVKDFFVMAYSFAKHIEKNSYLIDYSLFGELVCNMAQYVDIWYPQNLHAERTEDIPIIRALSLALYKIPSDDSILARLHAYMSIFYSKAWRYDSSKSHLDSAEQIDVNLYGRMQDFTCFAYAIYYENYGQYARSLMHYVLTINKNDNEYIKAYSSCMIALILALVGERDSCEKWLRENCQMINYIPTMHEISVIYYMTQSLLADTCDEAIRYLDQAELILSRLNHSETPIGCVLHYIRSQVWAVYGFELRSLRDYKHYVLGSISNFKPADVGEGGWAILMSGRIDHYLNNGSVTTAKMVSIKELDPVNIYDDSSLSFSVRSEVSKCYVRLYKALKLFPLARTYSSIYETNRKIYKPSQNTLNYIEHLFINGIPTTITLNTAWENALEQLHIDIYMMEEHQISHNRTIDDIRKRIDELRLQYKYPELNVWLLIAEGRLDAHKDIRKAVEIWKRAIDIADNESIFWVAREAANWSAYYGAIFEAADLYKLAIHSELFQEMPDYSKFDCYLEYVSIIEKTGYRSLATPYWNRLETIANEEQLPWLYYNRALVEFDQEQWSNCRVYLMDFFNLYKQTEQHDEILSSAYCYYCSVLTRFGEYLEGLKSIQKSFALWIAPDSFDTFPLYCNKAHCEIGLNDFSSARKTLKQAEKFVGGSTENKQMLDDLYEFLHEQRNIYFKKDKL